MPHFMKRFKACLLTRLGLFLHLCQLTELPPTRFNIYAGDLKDCTNQDHIHYSFLIRNVVLQRRGIDCLHRGKCQRVVFAGFNLIL